MPETIGARVSVPAWAKVAATLLVGIGGGLLAFMPARREVQLLAVACAVALVLIIVWVLSRYRESLLVCEALPVQLGSRWRGHIEAGMPGMPDGGFRIVLRCEETSSNPDSAAETAWEDEVLVDASTVTRVRSDLVIPFTFEIPEAGKPTSENVWWSVDVTTRGYAARFSITVV